MLNPAIYPPQEARRSASAAPGCPAFGDDSVLDRGPKVCLRPADRFGLACTRRLPTGLKSYGGIRQSWSSMWRSRSRCASSAFSRRIRTALPRLPARKTMPAGNAARDEVLARASRPSISVQTVTALSRAGWEHGIQVEVVARSGPKRPGGRRFGALVHYSRCCRSQRTREEIERAAAVHGRLVDATEEEIDAAATTVIAALPPPHAQGCSVARQLTSRDPDYPSA